MQLFQAPSQQVMFASGAALPTSTLFRQELHESTVVRSVRVLAHDASELVAKLRESRQKRPV